jgi:DNA-binding response OmpR family regulator
MMWNYDVVILDLWLWSGEWDGITICKEIREKWNNVPVLMLTARTLTPQKIQWLDSGADDYMTKPFDYEELLARLKSLSRRNDSLKWQELLVHDVVVNLTDMSVLKNEVEISLSKLEFNLLVYLAQNKWRVLTKEQITEKVWWEIDLFKESRTLDIYIWYLRKKLWSELIDTVRGSWYMIK